MEKQLKKIQFFLPMKKPPEITAQEKGMRIVHGKPVFFEKPEIQEIRASYRDMMVRFAPDEPIAGPVQFSTIWVWPASSRHPSGSWKITKPDTDNLVKLLKDAMTDVGFWKDDSQVSEERTSKYYGIMPGIYVEVSEIHWKITER